MNSVRTCFLAIILLTVATLGAVPGFIPYQGQLTAPDGTPLDTTVAMSFALYADSVGGTPVWSESHPAVVVTDGLFQRNIGIDEPIPDTVLHPSRLWLGVTVGSDAELQPRIRVSSVPYSRLAGEVDSLKAENVSQMLQLIQALPDADGDGHTKMSAGGDDCDDLDPAVYAGAPEICDGKDNDCDHTIDEGFNTAQYADADADGFGDPTNSVFSCNPVNGYVGNDDDCDDTDPARHPGATEVCDGIDENCDGLNDTDIMQTFCIDSDGDGFGMSGGPGCIQACTQPEGHVPNGEDCDDSNPQIHPGAPEICDGLDNNCDNVVDPQGTPGCTELYFDQDGDGYGGISLGCQCDLLPGWTPTPGDCDDNDPQVNPGATEICDNGIDDDCDGDTDAADSECP